MLYAITRQPADGNRLAVQVEVYRDSVLPYEIFSLGVTEKNTSGQWQPVDVIREGIYRQFIVAEITTDTQVAIVDRGLVI